MAPVFGILVSKANPTKDPMFLLTRYEPNLLPVGFPNSATISVKESDDPDAFIVMSLN